MGLSLRVELMSLLDWAGRCLGVYQVKTGPDLLFWVSVLVLLV